MSTLTSTPEARDRLRAGLPVLLFADDQLYFVQEAAKALRYSRSSIYAAMDRGDLPYVKLGGARRLLGRDLNDLVARGRVDSTAGADRR
jgi:excisionase family DNA binding protein